MFSCRMFLPCLGVFILRSLLSNSSTLPQPLNHASCSNNCSTRQSSSTSLVQISSSGLPEVFFVRASRLLCTVVTGGLQRMKNKTKKSGSKKDERECLIGAKEGAGDTDVFVSKVWLITQCWAKLESQHQRSADTLHAAMLIWLALEALLNGTLCMWVAAS